MTFESSNILTKQTSFQNNAFLPISKVLTIGEILNSIKGSYLKDRVTKLRELYLQENKQEYSAEKLQLPAVTFCATFDKERKKENLIEYNNLIVIDIDKLSKEQIVEYEQKLANDKFVMSFWRSPSDYGIKGLVKLDYNFELNDIDLAHKSAFYKLYNYFEVTHNIELDKSGSDTTRLCFLSYDLNLILKDTIVGFPVNEIDLKENNTISTKLKYKTKVFDKSKRNALYNPQNRNNGIYKREMKDILNYLTKSKKVITGDYDIRYKIAYAIANTFTFEIGQIFFLDLCKLESDKYNEVKELRLLEYCYENNSGLIDFDFIKKLVREKYNYKQKTLENAFSNGTKK